MKLLLIILFFIILLILLWQIRHPNVVVVTPAGRKVYLELLIPQILSLRPLVHEYRLWVNTSVPEDIEYMEHVSRLYPDFIKIERLPDGIKPDGNKTIHHFFKNCTDSNTIYVRFDDDIIKIDSRESFKKFIEFRRKNTQYFLVYGNILNNSVITHIHQQSGRMPIFHDLPVKRECMCDNGWKNPFVAESLHRDVLQKGLRAYCVDQNWEIPDFTRVSINCISWLGSTFKTFNGNVGDDEEQWLSVTKPKEINKMNCIFGNFACVHYAFFTQRSHLDTTDILEKYRQSSF